MFYLLTLTHLNLICVAMLAPFILFSMTAIFFIVCKHQLLAAYLNLICVAMLAQFILFSMTAIFFKVCKHQLLAAYLNLICIAMLHSYLSRINAILLSRVNPIREGGGKELSNRLLLSIFLYLDPIRIKISS